MLAWLAQGGGLRLIHGMNTGNYAKQDTRTGMHGELTKGSVVGALLALRALNKSCLECSNGVPGWQHWCVLAAVAVAVV